MEWSGVRVAYGWPQVLHFLQANRARIFVVGDSLQKQLHTRLVHMFRGSTRIIDYRCVTVAEAHAVTGGLVITSNNSPEK